jgi:hypothetical protein
MGYDIMGCDAMNQGLNFYVWLSRGQKFSCFIMLYIFWLASANWRNLNSWWILTQNPNSYIICSGPINM